MRMTVKLKKKLLSVMTLPLLVPSRVTTLQGVEVGQTTKGERDQESEVDLEGVPLTREIGFRLTRVCQIRNNLKDNAQVNKETRNSHCGANRES